MLRVRGVPFPNFSPAEIGLIVRLIHTYQCSNKIVPRMLFDLVTLLVLAVSQPLSTVVFTLFAGIAIIVFLTLTQPFYLKLVAGIDPDTVGRTVGSLGTFDEVVAMAVAPYVGSLVDGGRQPRLIQVAGFALVAMALLAYSRWSHPWVVLYLVRGLFAAGITLVLTMLTVFLNHIALISGTGHLGKFAAVVGMSLGLGAIFAVLAFTTLPTRLSHWFDYAELKAVAVAYLVVAVWALASLVITAAIGPKLNPQPGHPELLYWQRVKRGYTASKGDRRAQLALLGGFVLRLALVANLVFIPLFVYKWYLDHGECRVDQPLDRFNCAQGFKFLAILTGVSQMVALISSPFWGYITDKLPPATVMGVCGGIGIAGSLGFVTLVSLPKLVAAFVMVSLLGCAQLGVIISLMSMLAKIGNQTSDFVQETQEAQVIGTLLGFYTFCGNMGILVISFVGGWLSDGLALAPFVVIGVFYLAMAVQAVMVAKRQPPPLIA